MFGTDSINMLVESMRNLAVIYKRLHPGTDKDMIRLELRMDGYGSVDLMMHGWEVDHSLCQWDNSRDAVLIIGREINILKKQWEQNGMKPISED